jgi:hypothetical protein
VTPKPTLKRMGMSVYKPRHERRFRKSLGWRKPEAPDISNPTVGVHDNLHTGFELGASPRPVSLKDLKGIHPFVSTGDGSDPVLPHWNTNALCLCGGDRNIVTRIGMT